jgi:hypothetical protein
VSCSFSRELLALHVEGDLLDPDAGTASAHVAACEECTLFLEQLRARLLLVKSLRRNTISPSECAGMRRDVMSIINNPRKVSGWLLSIERALTLGIRKRVYVFAAVAFLIVVSASVLAQMRHAAPATTELSASFDSSDMLLRPEQYRDWIFVGSSLNPPHSAKSSPNVYINPSAYWEYAKTGQFPEGTVMVLESANSDLTQKPALLASVKDRTRFADGWGFFDFTGNDGNIKSAAQALPESSGCRSCHEQGAETDHVFTQFYPVLRSALQESALAMRRPPDIPQKFI